MKKTLRIRFFPWAGVLLLLLLAVNCGYRLAGSGARLPDYIKTITIPSFDNKSTRYQAEQFATIAVRQEFIKRSRLQLVESREKADSLVEGEVLEFDVKPISSSKEINANLYKVRILLAVRFIDLRQGKLLFEGQNINFTDTYEIATGDFFSQETRTLQDIAEKFAESVVTAILENF
jgi:hypothetical protein